MAIPTAYLTTSKNARAIMEAIQKAGVPSRFTYEFLKQLGYPSSSDRPIIAVMKALGFLTEGGEPTDLYRRYKDPASSKAVMAEAMRAAYADVFTIDQQANSKTSNDLKGIFARLSDKGDAVNMKMATTFKSLSELADFRALPSGTPPNGAKKKEELTPPGPPSEDRRKGLEGAILMHHDVHIHLPESTNVAVYDAIFRSLREHLG